MPWRVLSTALVLAALVGPLLYVPTRSRFYGTDASGKRYLHDEEKPVEFAWVHETSFAGASPRGAILRADLICEGTENGWLTKIRPPPPEDPTSRTEFGEVELAIVWSRVLEEEALVVLCLSSCTVIAWLVRRERQTATLARPASEVGGLADAAAPRADR